MKRAPQLPTSIADELPTTTPASALIDEDGFRALTGDIGRLRFRRVVLSDPRCPRPVLGDAPGSKPYWGRLAVLDFLGEVSRSGFQVVKALDA